MSRPVHASPSSIRRRLPQAAVALLALSGGAVVAQSSSANPEVATPRAAAKVCVEGTTAGCHVRPKHLNVTVSDLYFDKLRWSSWGGRTAKATGRCHFRKMGTDDVSTGRGTMTASRRKRCHGHYRYSRITVTYGNGRRYTGDSC